MKINVNNQVVEFIDNWLTMFVILYGIGGLFFLFCWLLVAGHWVWGIVVVSSVIATCFACKELK